MSAVIVYAAAAAIAYAALAAIVCAAIFAIGEGDPVADVQRYRELTEAAHRLIPPGPALSDPEGETSAAIGRFLAEKEQARHELWASSSSRTRGAADRNRDPDVDVVAEDDRHRVRAPLEGGLVTFPH
ncbi:MAG TPA: hypothetical protein VH816_15335 [Gaiellaceae bacterium]|jgi:hypothetical protein